MAYDPKPIYAPTDQAAFDAWVQNQLATQGQDGTGANPLYNIQQDRDNGTYTFSTRDYNRDDGTGFGGALTPGAQIGAQTALPWAIAMQSSANPAVDPYGNLNKDKGWQDVGMYEGLRGTPGAVWTYYDPVTGEEMGSDGQPIYMSAADLYKGVGNTNYEVANRAQESARANSGLANPDTWGQIGLGALTSAILPGASSDMWSLLGADTGLSGLGSIFSGASNTGSGLGALSNPSFGTSAKDAADLATAAGSATGTSMPGMNALLEGFNQGAGLSGGTQVAANGSLNGLLQGSQTGAGMTDEEWAQLLGDNGSGFQGDPSNPAASTTTTPSYAGQGETGASGFGGDPSNPNAGSLLNNPGIVGQASAGSTPSILQALLQGGSPAAGLLRQLLGVKNTNGIGGTTGNAGSGGSSPLFDILARGIGALQSSQNTGTIQQGFGAAAAAADPFASQRPFYQGLAKGFSDGSMNIEDSPMFKNLNNENIGQTLQTLSSKYGGDASSTGQLNRVTQAVNAANVPQALAYNRDILGAAGANFGPGQAGNLIGQGTTAGVNSSNNTAGALGGIFNQTTNGGQTSPLAALYGILSGDSSNNSNQPRASL